MKKDTFFYESKRSCLILFKDDLLNIIDIFKKADCKDISITLNDYEYDLSQDDINEFSDNKIQRFKVLSREPYLYIDIFNGCVRYSCANSENFISQSVLKLIEEFLKYKKRKTIYYLRYFLSFVLIVFYITWIFKFSSISNALYFILIFSGLILLSVVVSFLYFEDCNKILFIKKDQRQNIFIRNKDRIIVGFLIGIPIAALSFLLNRGIKISIISIYSYNWYKFVYSY